MSSGHRTDLLELPRFRTVPTATWATLVALLLALLVLVVPQISGLPFLQRAGIALALLVAPYLVALAIFGLRVVKILVLRAVAYPSVSDEVADLEVRLERTEATLNSMVRERRGLREFRLRECWFYERAFVEIQRKPGIKLLKGDMLTIVQQQSGTVVAMAQITDERDACYVARLEECLDALWDGNMRQHLGVRSMPPPNLVAIHHSEEVNGDD